MAIAGREILNRRILKRKTVEVPEWECQIIIRELTGREAPLVSQGALDISKAREDGELKPQQVVDWYNLTVRYGWINEDGSHVLTDDDFELLRDQSQDVVERIATAIRELSGMKKKPVDAEQPQPSAVDDAKKNSTSTSKRGSGSV